MSRSSYSAVLQNQKKEMCRTAVVISAVVSAALVIIVLVIVLKPPNCSNENKKKFAQKQDNSAENLENTTHVHHDNVINTTLQKHGYTVETKKIPHRDIVETNIEEEHKNSFETKKIPYKEHLNMIKSFDCKVPRGRAFNVSDLRDEIAEGSWFPGPADVVTPLVTVLHRCDKSSGCCQNGLSCYMSAEINVSLEFYVTKGISSTSIPPEFKIITVKNHTECHCIEVTGPK